MLTDPAVPHRLQWQPMLIFGRYATVGLSRASLGVHQVLRDAARVPFKYQCFFLIGVFLFSNGKQYKHLRTSVTALLGNIGLNLCTADNLRLYQAMPRILLREGAAVFFRQSSTHLGFLSARYRSEPTRPRVSIHAASSRKQLL